LYRPEDEHDACGVGFVVDIKGRKSNAIVRKAMEVLINLEHRGACGCEANTGDGAGILIQTPDKFFRKAVPFSLPDPGSYGSGLVFLPRDERDRTSIRNLIATVVEQEGAKLLGWRDVPSDNRLIGDSAKATQPVFQQVFIDVSSVFSDADSATARNAKAERKLYIIRKRIENAVDSISINALSRRFFYIVSLSCNTVTYKGMLTARQLAPMFPDLSDPSLESCLALVHQRFSTNTFPSWPLAHPYRYIAHNGEINTLRGNINWMRARQGLLDSDLLGDDLKKGAARHSRGRQ
jgi:glutamate synthase (ferredoxin)